MTVYLFLFAANAYCIDVDGIDGAEWRGAEVMTLLKGESNCNVTFGSVKWIIDEAVNVVYFFFQFHEESITVNESLSGTVLKVNNSDSVRIICDGTTSEYHSDLYAVSGAGSRNENNGSNCEYKVGFKHGIPSIIYAEVTFIDSEGNTSNLYRFDIDVVTETESQPSTVKITEAVIPEIIKPETTKKSEKTTEKAEKTTKKNKENSTKKTSTTKRKVKTTKAALTSTEAELQTTNLSITDSAAETTSALYIQTAIPSSNGKRYKHITMGAGAAALVLVAVLGVNAANKKAKENDPKS